MKIRALANGNVIEAHEDAAKQLIEAGIYEAAGDEPISGTDSTQPPVETKPTKKRKAR